MQLIQANATYWKMSPKQKKSVSPFNELACSAAQGLHVSTVY